MPVDLDALPEKLLPPDPPRLARWVFVVLLCALLGGALAFLFWPGERWRLSAWFWSCVLILPAVSGLMLFALRQLAYEKNRDYADSWNASQEKYEQLLIQQGQQAVAILASAYCSPTGSTQIAQTLRNGSRPLQALDHQELAFDGQPLDKTEQPNWKARCEARLRADLQQLLAGITPDLQRCADDAALQVRIRHNAVFGNDEIEALWRSCRGDQTLADQLTFASEDDGLLWLDAWLDSPLPARPILSVQFDALLMPVAGQAESASAVLLAPAQWSAEKDLPALALVHRPVQVSEAKTAIQRALLWGQVPPTSNDFHIWHSQLSSEFLAEVSVDLHALERSPDGAHWSSMDGFGVPKCAVGNMALVVASEQAKAERRAQLVLLRDSCVQACVIQPV
ncbi:hypothetical protein ACIPL1_28565 [Pseudomonas sp. NPDC090202]|uniref:hypothetical protein n=1 Tax=unclassified Pseudomonas TaxID=196821 RepID=UPI003828F4B7